MDSTTSELERLRVDNAALRALSDAGVSVGLGLPFVTEVMTERKISAVDAVRLLQKDEKYAPIFGMSEPEGPISEMSTSNRMALIDRIGLSGFKARLLEEYGG